MKWVSGAKYAAAVAGQQRALKELEAANKRDTERQATITRQAAEIARLRDEKPDSPVQNPKPAQGDAELRRQLNLALRRSDELQQRLDELQASNDAASRELQDLQRGVTS